MADGDDGNVTLLHTLRHWLKNPSNWLSLGSFVISVGSVVISVGTFLYVHFYPTSVLIYLPKQIAITAPGGEGWKFAVHTSLFNEAPSNKFLIIEDATLNVRVANAAPALSCQWDGISELMTTDEYLKRYSTVAEANRQYRDQISPQQRKLPFVVRGQELQTKLLIFICPPAKKEPVSGAADPLRVETTLKIMAPNYTSTSKALGYQLFKQLLSETEDGSWRWIDSPRD